MGTCVLSCGLASKVTRRLDTRFVAMSGSCDATVSASLVNVGCQIDADVTCRGIVYPATRGTLDYHGVGCAGGYGCHGRASNRHRRKRPFEICGKIGGDATSGWVTASIRIEQLDRTSESAERLQSGSLSSFISSINEFGYRYSRQNRDNYDYDD